MLYDTFLSFYERDMVRRCNISGSTPAGWVPLNEHGFERIRINGLHHDRMKLLDIVFIGIPYRQRSLVVVLEGQANGRGLVFFFSCMPSSV